MIPDAAGRCILYGSGDYRLISRRRRQSDLRPTRACRLGCHAAGVGADWDAKVLLGITGFATSSDLAGAVSAEQNARTAADTAEQAARVAADSAETARAEAEEAHLQSEIDVCLVRRTYHRTSAVWRNSCGRVIRAVHHTVRLRCDSFVVTAMAPGLWSTSWNVTADAAGADVCRCSAAPRRQPM